MTFSYHAYALHSELNVFMSEIRVMHIRRIDFNLLAVFDVIMAERSLSRAAVRLGMSQSAVSHALRRLRDLTGDDLFVRNGRGVSPTARADALAGPLRTAIGLAQAALSGTSTFDPSQTRRTFWIDVPAGLDILLLPALLKQIGHARSQLSLKVSDDRAAELSTTLRLGQTELAVDFGVHTERDFRSELLYEDIYVLLCRSGHPLLGRRLTSEKLTRLQQAGINWYRQPQRSPVQSRLERIGIVPNIRVSVPTAPGLAATVAGSDLVCIMHSRLARCLARNFDLTIVDLPIAIEPLRVVQNWHERFDADEGHRWLRSALAAACKSPPA